MTTIRSCTSFEGARISAISADRIFDGARTLVDHAVLIDGDRVAGVVPLGSLPPGINVQMDEGCTIMPGLIDNHVHFMRWEGAGFLAHGVTTVRDTGNDLSWILERREEWSGNNWPRILCQGSIIDGPRPVHPEVSTSCRDVREAIAAVRKAAAAGTDGIKLYVGLPAEWLPALVQAGHECGKKVSMHCSQHRPAMLAGVDEAFHLDGIASDVWPSHPPGWLELWGEPAFASTQEAQLRLADEIRNRGMTITPTLSYWNSRTRLHAVGQEQPSAVPGEIARSQAAPADPALRDKWRLGLAAAQGFVRICLDHGVRILAGTDVPFGAVPPGLSLWREMRLLVESGMTPLQALRSATRDSADFLGRQDIGRLAEGSAADLVAVRGNPLESIPERPELTRILRGGESFDPRTLLLQSQHPALTDDPWTAELARSL